MKTPRTRIFALLAIALVCTLAASGYAGDFDGSFSKNEDSIKVENLWSLDYGRTLLRDFGYVFGAPLEWNADDWQGFTLRAAAILGSSALIDDPVQGFAQRSRGSGSDWFSDQIDNFGADYPSWVMGGFFLGGLVLGNETMKMVALDGLAANLIACEIVTPYMKKAFGRHRPYRQDGQYAVEPFSGHDSFPSGHATRAFVNAAVIAAHYDQWWVKAIAYGVASLVSFARINDDAHYVSDVLAGAVIGIAIGEGIVHVNKKARGF